MSKGKIEPLKLIANLLLPMEFTLTLHAKKKEEETTLKGTIFLTRKGKLAITLEAKKDEARSSS